VPMRRKEAPEEGDGNHLPQRQAKANQVRANQRGYTGAPFPKADRRAAAPFRRVFRDFELPVMAPRRKEHHLHRVFEGVRWNQWRSLGICGLATDILRKGLAV
jgi:hypothetical protein